MRLISIDLETTGLDPDCCQILDFGAVVFDTLDATPVDELPAFHMYVTADYYGGEPYALGMHAAIFKRLATREAPYLYAAADLGPLFRDFLDRQGFPRDELTGKTPITCTGKNYARFDDRFLSAVPSWGNCIAVGHRVLDAGTLFFDPRKDAKIPDTRECLRRAGIAGEVAHTAVEDARDVIRLLRCAWGTPRRE